MGCGSCARAAAKRRGEVFQYEWTDGVNVVVYENELAAKAKVQRKGGSYKIKGT